MSHPLKLRMLGLFPLQYGVALVHTMPTEGRAESHIFRNLIKALGLINVNVVLRANGQIHMKLFIEEL